MSLPPTATRKDRPPASQVTMQPVQTTNTDTGEIRQSLLVDVHGDDPLQIRQVRAKTIARSEGAFTIGIQRTRRGALRTLTRQAPDNSSLTGAVFLFTWLETWADGWNTNLVEVNITRLGSDLGMKRATVGRYLQVLIAGDWLALAAVRPGRPTLYILNPELTWKGSGSRARSDARAAYQELARGTVSAATDKWLGEHSRD